MNYKDMIILIVWIIAIIAVVSNIANINNEKVNIETMHIAYFQDFKMVKSERIRKNLKKIEKNAKYHKE